MACRNDIDAQTVRDLLNYDAETGLFTWRVRDRKYFSSEGRWRYWNQHFPGTPALATLRGKDGYFFGLLLKKGYLAHRIAWLHHTGDWPAEDIDHINHNRSDNRICNLRAATRQQNRQNQSVPNTNKTGTVGVSWFHRTNRWRAFINLDRKQIHLGYFKRREDADAARKAAEQTYQFHPNHGKNITC